MKTPMELNSLLWNFFCYTPGLLYRLIRRDYGRLVNEAFRSIRIVSFKQKLNGLKITNWRVLLGDEKNFKRGHVKKGGDRPLYPLWSIPQCICLHIQDFSHIHICKCKLTHTHLPYLNLTHFLNQCSTYSWVPNWKRRVIAREKISEISQNS